jgi:hypothetical protein
MSHLTKVQLKIKDVALLTKVAEGMGLTVDMTVKSYKGAYTGNMQCEGIIRASGDPQITPYNCACVTRNSNGSFSIAMDNYLNPLVHKAGESCSKLTRGYSTELTKREMKNMGYVISKQETKTNGEVVLEFNGV